MTGSGATPTKTVDCTYTTVLSSKAVRYFAVAPVSPYERLLLTQLTADVTRLVSRHANNTVCCSALESSSGAYTPTSDSPCMCIDDVALSMINRRFADNIMLLGITFKVRYNVYLFSGGVLQSPASPSTSTTTSSASSDAVSDEPSLPFVWYMDKRWTFYNIVHSLFHALTRKTYLSALTMRANVFAHVTIEDVERMLQAPMVVRLDNETGTSFVKRDPTKVFSGDAAADSFPTLSVNTSEQAAAVSLGLQHIRLRAEAQEQHQQQPFDFASVLRGGVVPLASSATSTIDYCTILRGGLSAAYTSEPTMISFYATTETTHSVGSGGGGGGGGDGTKLYTYPKSLLFYSQDYTPSDASQCVGSLCTIAILCGAVIILLILAAGIAFVVQYCQRSRNERDDERKLLQRQLR